MENSSIRSYHQRDISPVRRPRKLIAVGEDIDVIDEGKSGPIRRIKPSQGDILGRIGQILLTGDG